MYSTLTMTDSTVTPAPRPDEVAQAVRRAVVESVDEVVHKHANPLADILKRAVLESVEEVLKRQITPILDRSVETLVASADKIIQERADPMMNRMRKTAVDGIGELLERQLVPSIDRIAKTVAGTTDDVVQRRMDPFLERIRGFLNETVVEVMQVHAPEYSRRVGKRAIAYGTAAGLFVLATVFLFLGGVQGLQRLGLPPYATYLAAGSLAALIGLLIVRRRSRAFEETIGKPVR